MVQDALLRKSDDPNVTRDIDPNVRQRIAANPNDSVWVNASAGSGKTKVLTDRVLRLLLPREDGTPGTAAHKILCLTFTKAGAKEMALRLQKRLALWASTADETLKQDLERKLLGRAPTDQELKAARELFAQTIDTPGGLKIMTIHSFCQSVLGRFPLEAGIAPYFSVIQEDQAAALLARACVDIFQSPSEELKDPLNRIAAQCTQDQFLALMNNIASERHQLRALLERHFGVEGLYTALCSALELNPDYAPAHYTLQGCEDQALPIDDLRQICALMQEHGKKTEQSFAPMILEYLSLSPQARVEGYETYRGIFLTTQGKPRTSGFPSKDVVAKNPASLDVLRAESARLRALDEQSRAAHCAQLTSNLMALGQAVLARYDALKAQQGGLDFDDLIVKTADLLRGEQGAAWVMYKLDQGLEHILIDEAQDTNPEQWAIIADLCEEFFTGETAQDQTRTVFTVGDEKQSIYSFQRASPEKYEHMRGHFAQKISQTGAALQPVPLNISFRSSPAVLNLVDAVFTPEEMRKGMGLSEITHHAHRKRQAGRVSLWPLCEAEEKETLSPWTLPTEIVETRSGAAKLADKIADEIKHWIETKEILPSHDRPIHPGDIMVLVRTRNSFVHLLTRALKKRDIPVSGADRMVLSEEIAVQDLMALAEFALFPEDDLSLACVLKSPLINMDEEELFNISTGRSGSLWQALQGGGAKEICDYLQRLVAHARAASPFAFFSEILQTPCPADDISGWRAMRKRLGDDAQDGLDEFLNLAIQFSNEESAALQHFLKAQEADENQVKREFSEHSQHVRIMTIHAAKGLEAPIVILPDTMRKTARPTNKADQRLLWPDKTGLELPLWAPRKDLECQAYRDANDQVAARMEDEYRRLLYVAMTRAEDRLYVGSYKESSRALEESWYHYIERGFKALEGAEEKEGLLFFENPQIGEPDGESEPEKQTGQFGEIPTFLYTAAPKEPDPPAPLVPSRASGADQPATSPLKTSQHDRFRRGNLTHKLLEILPELPGEKREAAAQDFITRHGRDLKPEIREGIVQESLAILNHPDYLAIFGQHSQAEVPVTGLMKDGRLISGQIDRLLITDQEVWVIDYKTNRPPPQNPEDVPEIYRAQMQAYADTLREIYPARRIKCALLWTDGPTLMPIEV